MTPLAEVLEFYAALDAAVYDCGLERSGQTIDFYYDADVMISIILGISDRDHRLRNPTQLLVRALIANGEFGEAYVLHPHAIEIHSKLQNEPKNMSRSSQEAAQARMAAFLEQHQVGADVEKLKQILTDTFADESVRLERFVDLLGQAGAIRFGVMDLARSPWPVRYLTVLKHVLRFSKLGPDIAEMQDKEFLWRIYDAIESARKAKSKEAGSDNASIRPISVLRDAAALCAIGQYVEEVNQSRKEAIHVRFYSESDFIYDALDESPKIQKRLTYRRLFDGAPVADSPSTYLALRTSWYFILRSAFASLSRTAGSWTLPTGGDISSPLLHVTFQQLVLLHHQLGVILRGVDEDATTIDLSSLKLSEISLGDVIKRFVNMSFLDAVWFRYHPPVALSKLLAGWDEVWSYSRSAESQKFVQGKVETRQHELADELSRFTDQQNLVRVITEKVRSLNMTSSDVLQLDSIRPLRDIGLGRWGFDVSPSAANGIQERLVDLHSQSERDHLEAAWSVVSLMNEAEHNNDAGIIALAILWHLGVYGAINKIVQPRGEIEAQAKLSWLLAKESARLRDLTGATVPNVTMSGLAAAISESLTAVSLLDVSDNPYCQLSSSYWHYYAWRSIVIDVEINRPDEELSSIVQKWAETSIRSAASAFWMFPRGSLGSSFAANMWVYVAAVTDRWSREIDTASAVLWHLRETGSDSWHYRFADTLAYQEYLAVQRGLRNGYALSSNESACRRVSTAQRLWQACGRTFGDPEVSAHLDQVRKLSDHLGCVDSE